MMEIVKQLARLVEEADVYVLQLISGTAMYALQQASFIIFSQLICQRLPLMRHNFSGSITETCKADQDCKTTSTFCSGTQCVCLSGYNREGSSCKSSTSVTKVDSSG